MRSAAAFLLLAALAAALPGLYGGEPERPALTILFTAEAHGALLPCDCPLQPLGGVVRRAALVKQYRARGPVVLLDGGGWAAGGPYDEESDGTPQRDVLRTNLMAKAMALLRYDLSAWGTPEAGAQAALANLAFLPPFVELFDVRPASAGRTGPRGSHVTWHPIWRSLPHGVAAAVFLDPEAGGPEDLAEPLARLRTNAPRAGPRVALCPLGEDAAVRIARDPGLFDLVLNAGRKSSTRVAWSVGDTVVANFDFQAQRLGVAELFPRAAGQEGAPGPRWEIRVRHVPLTPELPEDAETAALLAPHLDALRKKGKQKIRIEFWTMAECPYCKDLAPQLEQIERELAGRVTVLPRYVVGKDAEGRFESAHGERELAEDRVQALVARYYPERYWEWLRWRAKERAAGWEEGVRALGLLRARIAGALAAGEADELLERDYQLSRRRHVDGTPALVIANRTYEGGLERLKILRVLCGQLDEPKPAACAAVPACFGDRECRKRGFVGRCLDAGQPSARCDFSRPAVNVQATVLLEAEALWTNHERILEILLGYMPGLEWRLVEPASPEGQALAGRVRAERFPAYVLDVAARGEANFAENLGTAAEERGGAILLKPSLVGSHRLAARTRQRGHADLFVARYSKAGQEAVDVALEVLQAARPPELVIHDALYWNETPQPGGKVKRELAARGGVAEIEEAAIARAICVVAPERLPAYLAERGKRRASLFGWDRALAAAGIEAAKVRALAEGPEGKGPAPEILQALHAEADLLMSLGAGGDAVLLGENCELVPVQSREELRYYLEAIGKRRVEGQSQPKP